MIVTLASFYPYLLILAVSFGAATLLPFSSELMLLAQVKMGAGSTEGLLAAAIIGNTGGSVLNWWLGRYARHYQDHRWFPFKPRQIEKAAARFARFGVWSLLFAWLPVIGDPLTFAAGLLRVPFVVFLPLVALGKAARYGVLIWGV